MCSSGSSSKGRMSSLWLHVATWYILKEKNCTKNTDVSLLNSSVGSFHLFHSIRGNWFTLTCLSTGDREIIKSHKITLQSASDAIKTSQSQNQSGGLFRDTLIFTTSLQGCTVMLAVWWTHVQSTARPWRSCRCRQSAPAPTSQDAVSWRTWWGRRPHGRAGKQKIKQSVKGTCCS